MIDHARALLDRVDARRTEIADLMGRLVDEDVRLVTMRESLAAFIEQPGQDADEAVSAADRERSPAPVSQPSASGERRPAAGRRQVPDSARTRSPAASPTTAHSAPRVKCVDCGEEVRPMGLGPHRAKSKRHALVVNARAREAAGLPLEPGLILKNGRERWLCGRCSEPFDTRELRDEHQATHSPIPDAGGPVGLGRESRRIAGGVQIA